MSSASPPLPHRALATRLAVELARLGHPDPLERSHLDALSRPLRAEVTAEGALLTATVRITFGPGLVASISSDAGTSSHDVGPAPTAAQRAVEDRLMALLETTPLRCAFSGGKDSSVVLAMALNAARRLRSLGRPVAPLIVTSSDTGVENPEVNALRSALLEAAHDFADQHGLPFEVHVVSPGMSARFWPRILASRKLPSWPGGHGDCSVDMKIEPQRRAATRIAQRLAADGWPAGVTLVGSRRQESTRRAASMDDQGVTADVSVRGVLAPIADWTDAQVFDLLLDARAAKFPGPWEDLQAFYADAGAGECLVVPDGTLATRGGCGARSGCYTCQMVTRDHSAVRLASKPGYEYLAPLVALNDYLRATRWHLDRRHWFGKAVDPVTHHVAIAPQCYSFEETDRLMRILLTLDVEEEARAARHAAALAAGAIEATPRNRRLCAPQFRNLTLEDVIAVDAMRSIDGMGPEHAALRAWWDVHHRGHRYPVPALEAAVRGPWPATRYVHAAAAARPGAMGLEDPIAAMTGAERVWHETPKGDWVCRHPNESDVLAFEIDAEAAALFEMFELEERVKLAEGGLPATAAVRYYMRLGTVQVPKGRSNQFDAHLRRTLMKVASGLAWDVDREALQTISRREHDALAGAAHPASRLTPRPASPRDAAEQLTFPFATAA